MKYVFFNAENNVPFVQSNGFIIGAIPTKFKRMASGLDSIRSFMRKCHGSGKPDSCKVLCYGIANKGSTLQTTSPMCELTVSYNSVANSELENTVSTPSIVMESDNEKDSNMGTDTKNKLEIISRTCKRLDDDLKKTAVFTTSISKNMSDINYDEIVGSLYSIFTAANNVDFKTRVAGDLQHIDLEILDIEHKIELSNCNACEGYKLYKMLKDARIRRRKVKDTLAFLTAIPTEYPDIDNRDYEPRVLKELFI